MPAPMTSVRQLATVLLVCVASFGIVVAIDPGARGGGAQGNGSQGDLPAVVELFTSQGCSSCPPADRLLAQLAKKPGVIAMSFPVTYWDYLGWKDTLASPANNQRQRGYAVRRGDGEVYTPQVVVNGVGACVGSDLSKINAVIAENAAKLRGSAVQVKARRAGQVLEIEAGSAREGASVRSGTLWLAVVALQSDVAIARGENAGRKVTYVNVVRTLVPVGTWSGEAKSYRFALDKQELQNADSYFVLLQSDHLGPIVGAARAEG